MKLICFMFIIILSIKALPKPNSIDDAFIKNDVKVIKIETQESQQVYHVKLPFDPSLGRNSNRLVAEIASVNGCKSFKLVSLIDEVEIIVTAQKVKKTCTLSEDIRPQKLQDKNEP